MSEPLWSMEGVPAKPGVYLFRDAKDQVLYVGKARSLKARIRRTYNVSIAEVDDLDTWNVATFGLTMAGNDVPYLNGALDKIVGELDLWRDATLEDHQIEIIHPS